MKTSSISSLAISNAMRLTIRQANNEMIQATVESTTGKHADIGTALGAQTSASINLNRDVLRLDALVANNSIVTERLSSSQAVLKNMSDSAQQVLNDLTGLMGSEDIKTLQTLSNAIATQFKAFTDFANTSINGEYLLSGINTDVQPLADYTAAGSQAKLDYDAALSTFMAAQVPPLTDLNGFSAAQMEDFINNSVAPLFDDPAWKTTWSSATDQGITSRISNTEVVETSTNANTQGIRQFAFASVISTELFTKNLTAAARKVVADKAHKLVSDAIPDMTLQRTKLGLSENRVAKADESLKAQKVIIENHLTDLEGIDVYEASTRVKSLETLIKASYTLTAKLNELSLVNYL